MELSEARTQIDEIDRKLLALFAERLALMDAVLDYKVAHKLPVFDAAREAERLRTAAEMGGVRYSGEMRRLMEQTMEVCRDYQQRRLREKAAR